jgi:hypothetical protein
MKNYHFWSIRLDLQVVIVAKTRKSANTKLRTGLGAVLASTFKFQFADLI